MKNFIKKIIPYAIVLIIGITTKLTIIDPFFVNGDSMYPTLKDKEILILNRTAYYFSNIKRYDIVVIKTKDDYIIKRVIGLPGEHIKYLYGNLYINDKLEEDEFSKNTSNFDLTELGYEKIPEDKYLVLGDNRQISSDSRNIGLIDKKDIKGTASVRVWPLNKISTIK